MSLKLKLFNYLNETRKISYTKDVLYNNLLKLGLDVNKCLINSDYSIDVEGSVDITHKNLTNIPVKFRNVYGFFNCSFNGLNSLNNAPDFVEYDFYCTNNNLVDLENIPSKINGNLICNFNKISNLEHLNKCELMGDLNAHHNYIVSLKDLENIKFKKNINLSYNKILNLKGIQKEVKGSLILNNNYLNTLDFCPDVIIGDFDIRYNNIKTIKYFPKKIGGKFISNVFTQKDIKKFI